MPMESPPTFGQWLKQRRRELDLTQEAVADATGYSSDTIRKIEAGKRRPSRQITEVFADYLQIDPQDRAAFILWARGNGDPAPLAFAGVVQEPRATSPEPENPRIVSVPLPQGRATDEANLPFLPIQLIGREQDLAHLKALLWHSTTRLLTLVGPPGIGKTTLGIALAHTAQADFKNGLLYVPLGPISDPTLVGATIAEGLGVREAQGKALIERLQEVLRDKQMLLVLDNFEHVVSAAPFVSDLLAVGPQLKVLVTSRSPLHLRGEKLAEVMPLEVPDPQHLPQLEELARTGSVALFEERVRDFNSEFLIQPENAAVVAAICARLEGLPLAIELAAARTRILSLPSLLSRLERQLAVLTRGQRDVPAHHRTLRSSLELSYALLSEEEQRLFRRLSIFSGSFTFEAAEQVADATLDGMAAILDQSLLRLQGPASPNRGSRNADADADTYYTMLLSVREFALEQLEAAGEENLLALEHARYFLGLALDAERGMRGMNQKLWLDRTEAVYNNIRVALDWALKNGQNELALRMATGMRHFWIRRDHIVEGRRWLQQAIEQSDNDDTPVEARVEGLNALGAFYYRYGDLASAKRYLLEGVALCRTMDDRSFIVNLALTLSQVYADLGEFDDGSTIAQEGLSIARETGDGFKMAIALSGLARLASSRGDLAQAIDLNEQMLAFGRDLEVPIEIALALQNLGVLTMKQGDYRLALTYAEEAAAISAEIGDWNNLVHIWGLVGKSALGLGDFKLAADNFNKCLPVFIEQGSIGMTAFVFEEIGRVATRMGQPAKAARLFGVADALRESVGSPVSPRYRAEYDASIASIRESLSDAEFNAAWVVGRAMPLEEAVAYAAATR